MDRIEQKTLEKLYGKVLHTCNLNIQGFDEPMEWEIYDGFGYCPDYKGDEYIMIYPRTQFVNESKETQETIRKELEMKEDDEITIIDIISTFNELFKNGTKMEYIEETNSYREKDTFNVEY